MLSVPRRNLRRLIQVEQRALLQIKSDNKISNDKLFFIKHMPEGSAQNKWYLVQVDMDNSDPATMREYGVYCCWWYIRKHKDCTKHPNTESHFWREIRTKDQNDTLENMLLVRPSKVHNLLQNNYTYIWYQYGISLADHRIVVPFQFGRETKNILKQPNVIEDKQWKEL